MIDRRPEINIDLGERWHTYVRDLFDDHINLQFTNPNELINFQLTFEQAFNIAHALLEFLPPNGFGIASKVNLWKREVTNE